MDPGALGAVALGIVIGLAVMPIVVTLKGFPTPRCLVCRTDLKCEYGHTREQMMRPPWKKEERP